MTILRSLCCLLFMVVSSKAAVAEDAAPSEESRFLTNIRQLTFEGKRAGPPQPEKKVKPPRTHWDMLLERRTIPELQELLEERLDLLRAKRSVTP